MRAIRVKSFGGPEVLQVEDVAIPPVGAGQVRVRIEAAGVNPVDTYVRSGSYGGVSLPYTPGKDAAGRVDQVGPGVTSCQVGDRVYTSATLTGAYAEMAVCEAATVHPLPAEATVEQGAALGVPAGVAYYGLFDRGQAKPGETVLVHGGTGGAGLATIQLARAAGLQVIATAGDPEGEAFLREQGAHHATDHRITERPDELLAMTGGAGVDLIMEMLANQNLASDLRVLNQRARVLVIGSRGKVEIDPRELMKRDADVRGVMLTNASPEQQRGIYRALSAALEARTLRPVVGKTFALEQAAASHRELMEGRTHGKIVLLTR